MKTAQAWLDTTELGAREPPVIPAEILAVQVDALEEAAKISEQTPTCGGGNLRVAHRIRQFALTLGK